MKKNKPVRLETSLSRELSKEFKGKRGEAVIVETSRRLTVKGRRN